MLGKRKELRNMDTLTVNEMFGPTIQGEGPYAGHTAIFLRLGRCNLDCAWCDTPYTWDWKGKNGVAYDPAIELKKMSIPEVAAILNDLRADNNLTFPRLVVSGGEPLLQNKSLTLLLENLNPNHWAGYDIETNGTRPPLQTETPVTYVISPKLANSGVTWDIKWADNLLKNYSHLSYYGKAFYKFVIDSKESAEQARVIEAVTKWNNGATYFMPEGRTAEELDANSTICYESTYKTETKYSDRLHIRLWGDKRGV